MAFTVPLLPNPDIKVEYNPDIQEDVLQYQEYFLLLEMPCYKVVAPYHQTLPDPLCPTFLHKSQMQLQKYSLTNRHDVGNQ